ncbi:MAG: lipid-A-disaccharide synthase-related protein [Phormidesmis sp.]
MSNGHGEDVIALRILTALRKWDPDIDLSVLPLAGTGSAYKDLSIVGPTQMLPSGGFLNRDLKRLAMDVQKGLLPLTRSQLSALKSWAKTGDAILAVGDIVPLLFAYLSGLPYAFVGTAKSDYWLRDEQGKLPVKTLWQRLEGWSGSVYLPWERWLMSCPNCKAIFVRDALTAQQLNSLGIAAQYRGNPMMDDLAPTGKLTGLVAQGVPSAIPLYITLLPGSRPPEAYENWANILAAIPSVVKAVFPRPLVLLAAISPSLSSDRLQMSLADWQLKSGRYESGRYPMYTRQNATLWLISDAYNDCLHQSDIAIATAGTATEQFVGLGKPAITLPGKGPQFTSAFAEVQAKMLGSSVQVVHTPGAVGAVVAQLINDPESLQQIYQNGKHRMGDPGAGDRIAHQLIQTFLDTLES